MQTQSNRACISTGLIILENIFKFQNHL